MLAFLDLDHCPNIVKADVKSGNKKLSNAGYDDNWFW